MFFSLLSALKTNRWYLTNGLTGYGCGSEDAKKIVCILGGKYCALAFKNLWIPRLDKTHRTKSFYTLKLTCGIEHEDCQRAVSVYGRNINRVYISLRFYICLSYCTLFLDVTSCNLSESNPQMGGLPLSS